MRDGYKKLLEKQEELLSKLLREQILLEEMIKEQVEQFEVESAIRETSRQSKSNEQAMYQPMDQEDEVKEVNVGIVYSVHQENLRLKLIQKVMQRSDFVGVTFVFFTIDDLDINREVIHGFYVSENKIEEKVTKIPPLIYNLVLLSLPSSVKRMRQLRTMSHVTVINPINWFHQDMLFDMLSTLPSAKNILLDYKPIGESAFKSFLDSYQKLYVVPRRHYLHPHVFTVTKRHGGEVSITVGQKEQVIPEEDAYFSVQKTIRRKKFNIYEGIASPLTWNGLPAECRIYVQKGRSGQWEITSKVVKNEMFAKGSAFNHQTTQLEKVFIHLEKQVLERVKRSTSEIPVNLATYLDYFIPDVGCYHFDFLVNESGSIFLTYIGGVEQFDYLSRGMPEEWNDYLESIYDFLYYQLQKQEKVRLDNREEDVD